MNMAGFDPVTGARLPINERALPAAVRTECKDLFDISPRQNGGVERPGMIVRVGAGLGPHEPMQCAAIVEMVFNEGWRHPLYTNNRGAEGGMIVCD